MKRNYEYNITRIDKSSIERLIRRIFIMQVPHRMRNDPNFEFTIGKYKNGDTRLHVKCTRGNMANTIFNTNI